MRWWLLCLFLLSTAMLRGQALGIAYYNIDGLYDTIPSPYKFDKEYTPDGECRWTSERYHAKVRGVASVIDSMSMPVVGLFGVENESVVRDIVSQCSADYLYVHRTRNSTDGQDFSLLYFGDQLLIDSVNARLNMLAVNAIRPNGASLTIALTCQSYDVMEYLKWRGTTSQMVILGEVDQSDIEAASMHDPLRSREMRGQGNYIVPRGWALHDRIAVSADQKILKSGIFVAPWLFDEGKNVPSPTFDRGHYVGGNSKYLPIFVFIH